MNLTRRAVRHVVKWILRWLEKRVDVWARRAERNIEMEEYSAHFEPYGPGESDPRGDDAVPTEDLVF